MLLQLLQHLSNGFYVFFAFAFGVDKDVIKIQCHKNVEFLFQNLIDVALKYSRCVNQSKKHYLIFKMAIVALEDHFLFIAFSDPHLIINIG